MVETNIDIRKVNEGSGSVAISSPQETIEVTETSEGFEVEVADGILDELSSMKGLQEGFTLATKGSQVKRKFADLYWTNDNGAISYHKYFHVSVNKVVGDGRLVSVHFDLTIYLGNLNSNHDIARSVCSNIVYYTEGSVSQTELNKFKPENLIKVDYIRNATLNTGGAGFSGDPTTDTRIGKAVVFCDFPYTFMGITFNPVSSKSVQKSHDNVVWFYLNDFSNPGTYTTTGTVQNSVIDNTEAEQVSYTNATLTGVTNVKGGLDAVQTKVAQIAADLGGLKFVKLTQAQYDALTTKDSSTLYVIA